MPVPDVAINNDGANIPSVNLGVQGSDVAAPGSGRAQLYVKSGGVYVRFSSGDPLPVGPPVALAQGRLGVGDGSGLLAPLALGTQGHVVTADVSGFATWAAPAGGGGYTQGARARRTSDQTITTATPTVIAFDTQDYDTDGIWEGVTNPSRLTCQTTGVYLITGGGYWAGATGGAQRSFYIYLNGATQVAGMVLTPSANGQGLNATALLSLTAGDYVQLLVYHDRGSNLAVSYYAQWSPVLSMQRVG